MKRLREQAKIGVRWLGCGWRLLRRNPWLLLGMGLSSIALIIVLSFIPFAGSILLALLVPILMASAMMTADNVSQQQRPLPSDLKLAALAKSPKELFRVFNDDKRTMTVMGLGVYALTLTLLINIAAHLISDGSWVVDFTTLGIGTLFKALAAWLVAGLLYLGLAMTLVFTLPLITLRGESVFRAIDHSIKASRRHIVGLLVLIGTLITPFLVGSVVSYFSVPGKYAIWLVGGLVVLPLFVTSCYCSYRTVFPSK